MKATLKNPLAYTTHFFLKVLWWLEWAIFAIMLVVGTTAAIGQGKLTFGVPVTYKSVTIQKIEALNNNFPQGILKSGGGNLFIRIPANWQNIGLLIVGASLVFAAILIITYQLKMIFGSFKTDKPFTQTNITRILKIAYILIACSFVQWLFVIIVNQIFTNNMQWGDIKLTNDFNISYLFTGITLILVAIIFRLGLQLEEENKLTI